MKIYLDDTRNAPWGWVRSFTVNETIKHLETRQVSHLSLDNDLGPGEPEGFWVLDFLEETIYNDRTFPLPMISVHSANPVRIEYMNRTIQSIERIKQQIKEQ